MFDQRLLAPVNDDLLVTTDQACERTLFARVGNIPLGPRSSWSRVLSVHSERIFWASAASWPVPIECRMTKRYNSASEGRSICNPRELA